MIQEPKETSSEDLRPSLDPQVAERVASKLGAEKVLSVYRDMLRIRRFEEQAGRQYQMGKIKGFCHLYNGQESVAVGSMAPLLPRDYVVAAYREHGHAIAKGVSEKAVMAELFGRKDGVVGGIGGSMHLFDVQHKFYGGWGIVGGHVPTAAGLAFAAKYKKEEAVVLCYFGDGSIHQGVVHETMNMAQLWKLPVVLITENNLYAMGTSVERVSAVTELEKKAYSYDMACATVDGDDVFKVYEALDQAITLARTENLPTFLDVKTYRYRGHSMSDPAKYRTKEELEAYQHRDPILRMEHWLVDTKRATEEQLKAIDDEAKQLAKEAVAFAEASPQPDLSTLTNNVYVSYGETIL